VALLLLLATLRLKSQMEKAIPRSSCSSSGPLRLVLTSVITSGKDSTQNHYRTFKLG
jgi:hypothetical protein